MATDDRDDYEDEYDDPQPRPRRRRGLTTEQARGRVKGPAIGLIVLAVLSLGLIGWGVITYSTLPAQFEAQNAQIDANPQMQPAQKQQMKDMMKMYQDLAMKIAPVTWAVAGLTSLLMIAAGVKMMSLSGHGLGVTASIVAMIPCVSGCCLLGLPIGIWGLVVLLNPDVKAAFATARAAGRPEVLDPGLDDPER